MSCANASSSSAASLSTAPGARLRARAAELLLVGRLAHRRRATTGGPATNSCAVPRTITQKCDGDDARGAEPGARARAPRRRPGRVREVLDRQRPSRGAGHVGEAHRLERLDAAAAAGAVDEAHERDAQLVREPLGLDHLLPDRGVGGAAAHGEVVALDDRAPAVDPALADDHVRGQEVARARRPRRSRPCRRARRSRGSVPASNRRSIRSRTVRRPLACWRSTRSSPPISPRQLLAAAQLLELGLPAHRAGAYECSRGGGAG